MAKTTIVEVAERAGVSISTVSRYLKSPQSINPLSAAKISLAIKELEYVPNSFARNLKRGTTKQVGVVVPDISQYFFSQTIKSLSDALYQHGYLLLVCNSDYQPDKERFMLDHLLEQNTAGLVLATVGKNAEYLKAFSQKYRNIVLLEREESGVSLDCVTEDNEEKAYQLTQHLISKGARRIAIMGALPYGYCTYVRTLGICRAAAEAGIAIEQKDMFLNTMTSADAEAHMRTILEKEFYDTIVFINPHSVPAIRNSLAKKHLVVGRDMFLGGWSSREMIQEQAIDFPCVVQRATAVGSAVAELILRRLSNEETPSAIRQIVIKDNLFLP